VICIDPCDSLLWSVCILRMGTVYICALGLYIPMGLISLNRLKNIKSYTELFTSRWIVLLSSLPGLWEAGEVIRSHKGLLGRLSHVVDTDQAIKSTMHGLLKPTGAPYPCSFSSGMCSVKPVGIVYIVRNC